MKKLLASLVIGGLFVVGCGPATTTKATMKGGETKMTETTKTNGAGASHTETKPEPTKPEPITPATKPVSKDTKVEKSTKVEGKDTKK